MATTRAPLEPIKVGGDMGNATTSVAVDDKTIAFMPSVLTEFGVRRFSGIGRVSETHHHISYRGRHAVIGLDALEMPGYDTILNDTSEPHRRYTDPTSVMCFLAGLSSLFPEADTLAVDLATGAPISIYESHGGQIAAAYKGCHEYEYNGRPRRALIERVVVYGEGLEAWRLLSPEQRAGNVALHDLGGKTWNVILFADGVLRAHRTFEMGTERLLDHIPAVPRDAASRWALQSAMRRDPKAYPEVRKAMTQAILGALDVIERKVNLPRAHRHAAIGGGVVHLVDPLKERYRAAQILTLNGKQPEAVNAIVYAKALRGVA